MEFLTKKILDYGHKIDNIICYGKVKDYNELKNWSIRSSSFGNIKKQI